MMAITEKLSHVQRTAAMMTARLRLEEPALTEYGSKATLWHQSSDWCIAFRSVYVPLVAIPPYHKPQPLAELMMTTIAKYPPDACDLPSR